MRWPLLALVAAGCLFGPGLSSSTRDCGDSVPVDDGFEVTIPGPEAFVGYCMSISAQDAVDEDFALVKVPENGVLHLPVPAGGPYYMDVQVQDPDDAYCADEAHAFADHPGQGVVEVAAEVNKVCA